MPAPTNITALTATALSPPETVNQDVNDSGTTYTVWYKYTAQVGESGIGLFAYGDDNVYFVRARVYTGPAATPVAYLGFNTAPLTFDTPFQVPFNTPGETYYFEFFSADGDVAAGPLTLNVAIAPQIAATVGDIYITDENEDYPLSILDSTDATVKQFVPDFANGEQGGFLTDGTICLEDRFDDTVTIYTGTTEVTTVSFVPTPAAFISISGNRSDTFYLGNRGSGVTPAFVRAMSTSGVLGTTWTLAASGLYGMAPSLDDAILYWGNGLVNTAVFRHDLNTDLPLSNLVAGVANYSTSQDMFVLQDGSILVGYARESGASFTFIVKQYSAAGATLNTYNFNTGTTATHRLAIGEDDPDSFWLKIHTSGGGVTLQHIKISDGSTLATLTSFEFTKGKSAHTYALTETTHFGNASSCPFWISTVEPSGTIVVIKNVIQDGITTQFDFTAVGLSPTTFTLGDGDTQEFTDLAAGNGYEVAETTPAGWTTRYLVSNDSPIDDLLVEAGLTTTVTVTNSNGVEGIAMTLPIRRLRRSPTVYDENRRLFVPYIELDAQVGTGDSSGEEEDTNPEFLIKKSKDGGFTWQFERTVPMGKIGKYGTRVRLNRWGSGRKLVWEIVTSTKAYVMLNDLYFTVVKGEADS